MSFSLGIFIGLSLLCLLTGSINGVEIKSECRDRYLWVHVGSTGSGLQFEAEDVTGVHPIDKQLASRCGYTISYFKMDGYTTFRASYFSCYTENENDEIFAFKINIVVTNAEGIQKRYPLSKHCSLTQPWSQHEVICEEDYMEVTVSRDASCGPAEGTSKDVWHAALSVAQKTANTAWQVLFLRNVEDMAAMSMDDARHQGYHLSATTKRAVFRSPYRQPQSAVEIVDGIAVEVMHATMFYRQKLMVVMIDISMACTITPGSFDGTMLLWKTPRVMSPLMQGAADFKSKHISMGVESQLLDDVTVRARGYALELMGPVVQIGVPFGAEGGYRRSLVIDNVYRETYVVFLFFEHVFSHVYGDGSTVETRHRMLRVVDTPLLWQHPFTVDNTIVEDHLFSVYLGNFRYDVSLVGVKLNEKRLSVAQAAEHGYTISKVANHDGTHAYSLQVPFEDKAVHRMYLGDGLMEYSLDINYTLNIMPQRDPYHHLASVTAQLNNAFPPEVTAECTEGGIVFRISRPRLGYLWEMAVGMEPLTAELAAQNGYILQNNTQILTMEVPLFTVGYIYENIDLNHFYGAFEVLTKESKTLEIQKSTVKHCLFKTNELIACSSSGTMTVVTSTTATWPTVDPHRTTLLDSSCQPTETDQSRALFDFSLNSCGTRVMVGDSYVVYENEILSTRALIPDGDGTSIISRDSKFRLTVRCFYKISTILSLFVDRVFQSETPGFGSISVMGGTKDSEGDEAIGTIPDPSNSRSAPSQPNPGSNHFITVQGESVQSPIGEQGYVYGDGNQDEQGYVYGDSNQDVSAYAPPTQKGYGSTQPSGPRPAQSYSESTSHYEGVQFTDQDFGLGISDANPELNLYGSSKEDHFKMTLMGVHPAIRERVVIKPSDYGKYKDPSQYGTVNVEKDHPSTFGSNLQPGMNDAPQAGNHLQAPENYMVQKSPAGDNFAVQGVSRQPTTSKVSEISLSEDILSVRPQLQGYDNVGSTNSGLNYEESPLDQNGEVKPTKAQQISSSIRHYPDKYGLGHGQMAKPPSDHYGPSVGRTEIVHSDTKLVPGYYRTARRSVYWPPGPLTSSHHRYSPAQIGSSFQANYNDLKKTGPPENTSNYAQPHNIQQRTEKYVSPSIDVLQMESSNKYVRDTPTSQQFGLRGSDDRPLSIIRVTVQPAPRKYVPAPRKSVPSQSSQQSPGDDSTESPSTSSPQTPSQYSVSQHSRVQPGPHQDSQSGRVASIPRWYAVPTSYTFQPVISHYSFLPSKGKGQPSNEHEVDGATQIDSVMVDSNLEFLPTNRYGMSVHEGILRGKHDQ